MSNLWIAIIIIFIAPLPSLALAYFVEAMAKLAWRICND
jgi:hypothetical protein